MAIWTNNDYKQDKQLLARIKYTWQQMKQSDDVSTNQRLFTYAKNLRSQMKGERYENMLTSANPAAEADEILLAMQKRITFLQNQSQGDDQRTSDTDLNQDLSTFGGIQGKALSLFNGDLGDPQQAALFDLLGQMAGAKQQYTWQRESDDLAYQRTNFATLLAQYQAAGMSRAAALQAASSTLPTTVGSSVGAGISPSMLGAAAQNQNAGIAQQNVNTQSEAVQNAHMENLMALHNEQVRIANERWAMEQQYWSQEQMKHAYEEIQKAYELTYALHGNHVDVPLWATQSTETYKDWLRDGSDFISQLKDLVEDGTLTIDDDGNYCATYEWEGETKLTDPVVTAKEVHDASLMKQIYDEYQKHVGDVFYQMMYQQQFMNQAGPRAYHQQEDYSQLMMNKIRVESAELALREVTNAIESEEMDAAVRMKFKVWYEQAANEDERNRVQSILDANNLHINSQGLICRFGYQMNSVSNAGDVDASNWDVPLTALELARLNLVDFGCNMDAYYNALSVLQGAKLATDNEHFKNTFSILHEQDAVALSQLGLNKIANENALCLFDDFKWLQKLAGANIVWQACGFDRVAAVAGGVAVGGFKAASLVQAAKQARAHRMTESYDAAGNLTTSESWNRF